MINNYSNQSHPAPSTNIHRSLTTTILEIYQTYTHNRQKSSATKITISTEIKQKTTIPSNITSKPQQFKRKSTAEFAENPFHKNLRCNKQTQITQQNRAKSKSITPAKRQQNRDERRRIKQPKLGFGLTIQIRLIEYTCLLWVVSFSS